MEKKSLVLSVSFANLFNDKEERMKLGFKFKEYFAARKADKATGEYIVTKDNELSFTKKQFIFKLQDNFVINLMATSLKFEELLPIQLIGIFKDAKLDIERTRLKKAIRILTLIAMNKLLKAQCF